MKREELEKKQGKSPKSMKRSDKEATVIHATVDRDAGGYPYIPAVDLYDYENEKALIEPGTEVKIIIRKNTIETVERIPKYETPTGVPCTPQEEKLIDSLVRLSRKWKKNGKDLMLFSWAGSLKVVKCSALEKDTRQIFSVDEAIVADINGIPNDGGDPDTRML